ncbi:MAG: ECF-type riboflavin transporter substrate-binding protein [Candidatus Onthomonas sp.]
MKSKLGVWTTKSIVTMGLGAALYGVLMVYGAVPIFTNTNLSFAMIVPVFVGGLFGPLPAMITCGVGNVIADLIGGWGMWFDWSIGNAVMGLFVGMLPLYGADIANGVFKVKHAVIYAVLCVVGNMLAFGVVTPIFSTTLYGQDLNITLMQAVFATAGNTLVLVVAGIPILVLLSKRAASKMNLKKEADDNGEY